MKAEEFMIGNLVYIELSCVHAINANDLKFGKTEHLPCKPIKLTPDILLSIGFCKEPDDFLGYSISEWYSLNTDKYHLSLRGGLSNTPDRFWSAHIDNSDFQSIGSCDLQYLHQLQNFMTLVGHPLKIDLGKLVIKE